MFSILQRVGSSLLNGHSRMDMVSAASPVNGLGINKSPDNLHSFVTKAEELEQPCTEERNGSLKDDTSLPLSKSQLQSDFNLILEDSMDYDNHLASVDEMESIMETSLAPVKEALLVLDDSIENMSQEERCLERSRELERRRRNISVDLENSKHKLEGVPDAIANVQDEMDVLNSSQENSFGQVSIIDEEESDEEAILFSTKRKATRRICSESEAESSLFLNDENEMVFSPFNSPSVKVVSASTPKLHKAVSDKLIRSSLGRRRSVASRSSLVQVAIDDATDVQENIDDEDEDSDQGEEELFADEAQEADEEEPENTGEPAGETLALEESLRTSEEGYEADSFVVKSSSNEEITEESTGDVELLSDEQVDYLAPEIKTNQIPASSQDDSYSILVKRGKELKDGGHVKEALDCFLKALDIKSGDPEVMMLTLSLYRQLS